jgi:proteasome regulatory subunit
MDENEKVVYSETIPLRDMELENQALADALEKVELENKTLSKSFQRIEEEAVMLRELFNSTTNELNNLRKPSLLVADLVNLLPENKAIIKLPNGNKFYSYVSQDVEKLRAGDAVLVDQKSLNIVHRVELGDSLEVEKFVIVEKPQESWKEVGGLRNVIQEVKEVIELPLKKPQLFKDVGIKPPKGVLLYGPPGTGKTLLAKAVAHSTNATFIEVVGSELVQKFIGEGAKLVKEIFALARTKSPAIVFIDEIDALAAMRMDTGTSGEREVNRTFMQLLAELDGFKALDNVKIIGATNRLDILDRAIIRPGRLDRLIEVGLPTDKGITEILKVHTRNMNLTKVNSTKIAKEMSGCSGAEIRAICTEAGYFAIRDNRSSVNEEDFMSAIIKVKVEEEQDIEHKDLFG